MELLEEVSHQGESLRVYHLTLHVACPLLPECGWRCDLSLPTPGICTQAMPPLPYRFLGPKAKISFFFYKLFLVLAFLSQEQNITQTDPNTSRLGVSQLYQNLKCVLSASVEIQGKIRTRRQSLCLKPTNWYVLDMRNKGRHSTVRELKTKNIKWEAVCFMTL